MVTVPARPGGGGGAGDGDVGCARAHLRSDGVGGSAWGCRGGLSAASWKGKVRWYQLRKHPAGRVDRWPPGQVRDGGGVNGGAGGWGSLGQLAWRLCP